MLACCSARDPTCRRAETLCRINDWLTHAKYSELNFLNNDSVTERPSGKPTNRPTDQSNDHPCATGAEWRARYTILAWNNFENFLQILLLCKNKISESSRLMAPTLSSSTSVLCVFASVCKMKLKHPHTAQLMAVINLDFLLCTIGMVSSHCWGTRGRPA